MTGTPRMAGTGMVRGLGNAGRRVIMVTLVVGIGSHAGGAMRATSAASIPPCMLHTITGTSISMPPAWDGAAAIPVSMVHTFTGAVAHPGSIQPVLTSLARRPRSLSGATGAQSWDGTATIPVSMLHTVIALPAIAPAGGTDAPYIPLSMQHTVLVSTR